MNRIQSSIITVFRILVGIVFIFSGFVKGVDIFGVMYKFNDYFIAFSSGWATKFSFILSAIMPLVEFLTGVGLLLNLKIKQTSTVALVLMIIFTPLTLYIAIYNPVHDCGCFGDALIITNWQTFWKNIFLLIIIVSVFKNRKKIKSDLKCKEQWAGLIAFAVIFIFIMSYSYNHLPVIDFRPYSIGTDIPAKMTIPEDAPTDEYKSTFVYEKNGKQQEFGLDNLPDSTWTFLEAHNELIKKGYEPPIHDFLISSPEGDDITDLLLANSNYTFLLISHNINKYNYKKQKEIRQLANFCETEGYNFYCITSSGEDDINKFIEKTGVRFEFYNADEITLKTIIRSNPGLVLIKSGVIIDKWHYNDIPDVETVRENLISSSITKYSKKADKFYILLLISSVALMISLYLLLRKKWINN